jgi:anti-anti-sigma factor
MPLAIETQLDGNVSVFTLKGPMTLGPTLSALSQRVRRELAASTPAGLVIDVSSVGMVDSAGLGELTLVYTLAARRNCSVVLAGVTKALKHSLELTRLDLLLPSAPDIASAKKVVTSKAGS